MTILPLVLENITRNFRQGEETLHVLKGISLEIKPGEVVALVGHSGAGKSTLLQLAGLLEKPSSGRIFMAGQEATALNDKSRTLLRQNYAGFVYQAHHLQQEFSALENVMIPQLIAGVSPQTAKTKAKELLEKLGLGHRLLHRPKKLSGGEQQRVAIARSIANNPKIILADEPTGNLDSHTAEIVFTEMMSIVSETGLSALIATHNPELAQRMHRVLTLKEGHLVVKEEQ